MDQIVSLFSGAGGLSLGFQLAGMKPAFAADVNADACATYEANLNLTNHLLDLGSPDKAQLERLLQPYTNCMAVIGGPPCQGFSTAGSRNSEDPRNRLVFSYLDVVDFLKPRWFLFENVEGILTSGGGQSLHDLAACFIQRGYTVRIDKLNLASYGLPQSRKRVLIMGNNVGRDFAFPDATHSFSAGKHRNRANLPSSPSLLEAIADLPLAAGRETALEYPSADASSYALGLRLQTRTVRHHFATPTATDVERYAMLKPGQTMKDLPESSWHPSFRARAFRRVADGIPSEKRGGAPSGVKRLRGDECSPTITSAASRELIHPSENRPLTLREAARLQGFPDSFEFVGPRTSKATQIGNAVPPPAARVIATALAELDGAAGGRLAADWTSPGLLGFRLTDATGKSPALQETERKLLSLPVASTQRSLAYG